MTLRRLGICFACIASVALAAAPPAHALRVVTWNLTFYPQSNLAGRQPSFRTVMANINADVLIAQELDSAAGRDSFFLNVLDVVEPGQWAESDWYALGTEGGAIFYKPAKVGISFTSTLSTSGPRPVLFTRVTPVGYTAIAGTFRVYSIHLKAGGPGTVDSTTRRMECADIRAALNLAAANTNILLGGDSNFYGAYEGGYIRFTESEPDNDGRLKDCVNMPGDWHVQAAYAPYYTQCPCATGCPADFSGGGLDDRFDIWLSTYVMQDGNGVDLVPGSYSPYGNDGQHFNSDINGGGFNNAVPIAVANALHDASDHLPVVITVQLASKVQAASAIDFGSVLIGATAQQLLAVTNPAPVPADILDYTLAAPAGFTAPGGTFHEAAGAAANTHTLGMTTAAVGAKSGTLTLASDAPDSLSKPVLLSGKVLAHAVASLDSATLVTSQTLDFGTHDLGTYADLDTRVHNRGYGALQARLSVNSGAISGGAGRFSIVGGFTSALLAGTGKTYTVRFNDAGATPDSTYNADLTFASTDEPLPGATAAGSLTVHLTAHTPISTTDVGPENGASLAFLPPRPNPLRSGTEFAFALPNRAEVSLEVFDLSGRRVARVVDGAYDAGEHHVRWEARDDRGVRLGAGLYFAHFRTAGLEAVRRVAVLP